MSLAELKKKIEAQKRGRKSLSKRTPKRNYGTIKTVTAPKLSEEAKRALQEAKTTEEVQEVLDRELPGRGYIAVGRNDKGLLKPIAEGIRKTGLLSFDYETDGDPDDDTQDPQDHEIVGVSVSFQIGQAFYFPIGHVSYGANWTHQEILNDYLASLLLDPNITIIAHNAKAEYQWSLLYGIDLYPKMEMKKFVDTMLLVKQLALRETIGLNGEVQVGLKPATKALLADRDGMVHGLIHVDDIKSFKETVGKVEWEEPIPGEFYKSGPRKGQPKVKKMSRSRTFKELPINEVSVNYACSDADWALGLYHKLMPVLEAEGLTDVFFELNVPFMAVLGDIELTGWKVRPEKLEQMEKIAHKALYGENGTPEDPEPGSIEAELYNALIEITKNHAGVDAEGNVIVPAGTYGMGEWRGEPTFLEIKASKPFNWGSVQHKQWLFFHVLRLDTRGIARSNKTGLPGTGKDELDSLIERYEGDSQFMKILKERNKYEKILKTYVYGIRKFIRKDTFKVHTQLNLVSTWRLSSKNPNLQNFPRADNDPIGTRELFEAPTYDPKTDYSHLNIWTRPTVYIITHGLSGETVFVGADYAQIELKVLAWYAMEQNMIDAFINNVDLHSRVAKQVFHLDCDESEVKVKYKPYRYRAKKVNFGIVYGMTEYGLSADKQMGMTVEEARQFIDRYMATYPGIKHYAESQISFAREYGYVETLFGNRRPILDINHPNKWIRQSAENKAMNTPIQGSAADIMRRAMVEMKRRAKKEAPWIKQVIQIHDDLMTETPVEYAAETARFVKNVMESPIEGFSEILPITCDPYMGKIWAHVLDIEWTEDGRPYVTPKKEKKEPTDVTYEEIQYALPLYKKAGIEVIVP